MTKRARESRNLRSGQVSVVTDLKAYHEKIALARRQARAREDREYQQYGRTVAERMIRLDRGHRYRIRKYRRKNAELGWFLARRDVQAWLKKWHVKTAWVVGLQNTTQLRDGKIRETATIISCGEGGREWQVAVPEKWPRQGRAIPRVLS